MYGESTNNDVAGLGLTSYFVTDVNQSLLTGCETVGGLYICHMTGVSPAEVLSRTQTVLKL